jgi:hypothetical protein
MIATLTFNLPEETEEHQAAIDGQKWKIAMHDLDRHFRDKLKYGHPFLSADEVFEFARQSIYEILTAEALALD